MVTMLGLVAHLGRRVRRFLFLVGNLSWLLASSVRALLLLDLPRGRIVARQALQQVRFTGVDAWPFVLFAGLGIGATTIIQAYTQLSVMAERYLGTLLVVIVIRELGPLAAAVLVIGRSGTAIAAELGAMRLNHEVDALEAFGIDPLQYLLLPRLFGVTFSLFGLIVIFDAAALAGGYAVAGLRFGLPFDAFTRAIGEALHESDLVIALTKGVLFGTSVALVASYQGLATQRIQTEIPQAVTRAVVVSLAAVLTLDSIISALVYA